jgi:NAD(P)-dependent dehydrogenase (short-subunit alcohol dehydrogenase family)
MPVFRDNLFVGKTAFIAGGTSGINLRIAERFVALGARVAVFSRSDEKVGAAVDLLSQPGQAAFGFSGDVRDYEAVSAAFASTEAQLGKLDFVVSGAAGNFMAPALGMSANGFKTVVDIDLIGTFNVFRASHEHLRQTGASLLAISAVQSIQAAPMQAHVSAAKAGVDMLTKSLALEWGPMGIRVNAILPGPVDDTEGMKRLGSTPEIRERIERSLPLQRYATKDEVADMAVFLCSDAASYVTGSLMRCDGGQLAGHPLGVMG